MDPNQNLPQTLCNKCKNYVLTQNFLIHEARCKGPTNSTRQPSRMSSRIFNSSSRISNTGQNSQNSRVSVQEEEKIPCPYCSYPQTLAQLDTHPQVCQHREEKCSMCNNSYPKSLMQDHIMFCPANRRSNYPQVPNYQNIRQQESPGLRIPRQMNEPQYNPFPPRRQETGPQPPYYQNEYQNRMRTNQRMQPHSMMEDVLQMFFNNMPARRQIRRSNSMEQYPSQYSNVPPPSMQIRNFIQLIHRAAGRGATQQGLTKQDIREFPVHKYKNNEKKQTQQQDMCIICYCSFEQGQDCMTLPCKHIFHPQCVGTWLMKNPSCPVCKHNYGPKREEGRNFGGPHQFIRVIRFG